MGMTNRVMPAQGEERGATFTLIQLDGDASQKFQGSVRVFLADSPTKPSKTIPSLDGQFSTNFAEWDTINTPNCV